MIFLKGFGIGLGLIVAIGAQNAYVLTRGICRNHHWIVAFIGSLVDALLICAGILGMGRFVQQYPQMSVAVTLGGVIFLLAYGALSFRKMMSTEQLRGTGNSVSFRRAVVTMLAFSFLNPHVYLDTVVLVGSIAIQEQPHNRWYFGAGAITASFVWFFTLSLGGQLLQPWFQSARTWKVLDFCIGVIMWGIALTLIIRLV